MLDVEGLSYLSILVFVQFRDAHCVEHQMFEHKARTRDTAKSENEQAKNADYERYTWKKIHISVFFILFDAHLCYSFEVKHSI